MQTSTNRTESFSDGVMAIMITIMVLELKLPDFNERQNMESVKNHLLELIPHFADYMFSFVMIGIFWMSHHHLFHLLEKTDNFLIRLNLFFLFWITLIPLVTGIVGANPLLPDSIAMYGGVMLMATLSLSYMRSYTLKNTMVHADDEGKSKGNIYRVSKAGKQKSYIASIFYLAAIPLAFINIYLAYVCFVIPIILFSLPTPKEEEKLENTIIERNKN